VEEYRSLPKTHITVVLRGLVPFRRLTYQEALYYAEQQAMVLLRLARMHEPPVPVERLVLEAGLAAEIRDDPPVAAPGTSSFNQSRGEWVITINPDQQQATREFVIAHEVKHILDDGFGPTLYRPVDIMTSAQRKEYVADYFAACLTMPRLWVERAWRRGHQDIDTLAEQFGVLPACMWLRLEALRLLQNDDVDL